MYERTARIIGEDGVKWLATRTAAVFGVGGVGSYAAEALVRAGVGRLIFIDKDTVDETNLNRQLVAERGTIGEAKADVMVRRAHNVNPHCDARGIKVYFQPGDSSFVEELKADFIIDAIDDIPAKIALAQACSHLKIPLASSMGTGNRLRPELLEVADISHTSVCPLARKMRRALREAGVPHLTVVYSKELPCKPIGEGHAPGSISFVPPAAGMILAGIAVRTFLAQKEVSHEV